MSFLNLILVRHAEAESNGHTDHARILTPAGRQRAAISGKLISQKFKEIDLAIISDAARTKETFLELKSAIQTIRVVFESRLYSANTPADLKQIVSEHIGQGESTVMLIGHNPIISTFASYMSGDFFAFAPADFAILRMEADHWLNALEMTSMWEHTT
jgi:phosphohistidine phosphatase